MVLPSVLGLLAGIPTLKEVQRICFVLAVEVQAVGILVAAQVAQVEAKVRILAVQAVQAVQVKMALVKVVAVAVALVVILGVEALVELQMILDQMVGQVQQDLAAVQAAGVVEYKV